MQIKTIIDITTHWLELSKSGTLATPNAGEGIEQKELLLLVGIQNGTAALENSLLVSYKMRYTLTIRSSNCIPWYLGKGVQNLSTQKPCI